MEDFSRTTAICPIAGGRVSAHRENPLLPQHEWGTAGERRRRKDPQEEAPPPEETPVMVPVAASPRPRPRVPAYAPSAAMADALLRRRALGL